jgi:hypothetical protein
MFLTADKKRRLSKPLFLASLLCDLDMVIIGVMVAQGFVHPAGWNTQFRTFFESLEACVAVAATVFWLLMFYDNLTRSGAGLIRRVICMIGLMVTIWFGAQMYYLVSYRKRWERGGSTGSPA